MSSFTYIINDLQGAYCHGRSSEHILLYAVDTITQALDNGDSVCAAFLDLRKAFDSLDHCLLLQCLFDLGVSGVELKWFTDYLSQRRQRVKYGAKFSDWGSVLGGIPQGSALGPLLFLIYVNDMPLQVEHSSLLQFADDTYLICCDRSPTTVSTLLNVDLRSLSSWVCNSKMQFNIKKSSVMWFSTKSCNAVVQPQVLIDETPLLQVNTQKYLGVTFDSKLTWHSHVAAVYKSMAYYLYLIGCHSKSLPCEILKMLVESLVFSCTVYLCPTSLGPAISQESLSRINRLHNRGVTYHLWITKIRTCFQTS